MNWFFYALLAPFLFGSVVLLDKFLVDKKVKEPVAILPLFGFLSLFLGLIPFVLGGVKAVSTKDLILLLVAGFVYTIYAWPYFKALMMEEASKISPLYQTVSVFALILSYIFLKEVLTVKQLVGFFLVFMGGITLSSEGGFLSAIKIKKSFWLMMFSSFMYASASVLVKATSVYEDFRTTFIYLSFGMGIGALAMLIPKYIRVEVKKYLKDKLVLLLVTLGNLFGLLGQLAQIKAFEGAPVSLVNVVAGVEPLFVLASATVLSVWFPKIMKEEVGLKIIGTKLLSILAIFAGLYLVYS